MNNTGYQKIIVNFLRYDNGIVIFEENVLILRK